MLDAHTADAPYTAALAEYRRRVEDPALTPSARVLAEMREHDEDFIEFAMRVSRAHEHTFKSTPLDPGLAERFEAASRESLAEQAAIEADDTVSFEDYVAHYFGH
ncbi:Glutamate--cysteine ligase [wastewater metagenome]|uniref:Glutamate--cysteine ligase n=4 Tax=root TaxID=1 RepID=A0A5B8RKS3_9ZZZZ|nr:glutamate--cysteine ligase [uncultured organism]